jgi:hypothetical protein
MKNTEEILTKLLSVIHEQINDKESEYYIDLKNTDITKYIHALANQMPCMVYSTLTNTNCNLLEFNHIANNLCFQYMKQVE